MNLRKPYTIYENVLHRFLVNELAYWTTTNFQVDLEPDGGKRAYDSITMSSDILWIENVRIWMRIQLLKSPGTNKEIKNTKTTSNDLWVLRKKHWSRLPYEMKVHEMNVQWMSEWMEEMCASFLKRLLNLPMWSEIFVILDFVVIQTKQNEMFAVLQKNIYASQKYIVLI